MKSLKSILLGFGLVGLSLFSLTACSGGGGSSSSGTLQVAITDAATPTYNSVVIAIREIRVVPAGDEGTADGGVPLVVAYDPPKSIDVLDLKYQQELLGEVTLPDGDYTQLRLILAANVDGQEPVNYITLASDPTKIPLRTPSGQTSGLKIVGDVTIIAGEVTTIVLDFDPARAIVQAGGSGNWNFKPTGIRVVQVEELLLSYGAIAGAVLDDDGTTLLTDARIYAVSSGTVVAGGAVNSEDATFRLLLPAGSYELRATADGYTNYTSLPALFPVSIGDDTTIGNIEMMPLLLP